MKNMNNEPNKKIIEVNGKKFEAVKTSCACCKKCWQIVGSTECIYGGPFDGYVEASKCVQNTLGSTEGS